MRNGISLYALCRDFFRDSTFSSSFLCPHNYHFCRLPSCCPPPWQADNSHAPLMNTNCRIHGWHRACLNHLDTRVPLFLLQPGLCQHAATHSPVYHSILLQLLPQNEQRSAETQATRCEPSRLSGLASYRTLTKKPPAESSSLCWTIKAHRACSLHFMMPKVANSPLILMVF